jgi:DNA mismatch repair protein MutS
MARVGDFYEFYFDQAEVVARALGLKLAQGKYRGKEHVFCGFPAYKMNDYVRMLMGHGFTIAKYEQYESLQLNGQKIMTRKVDRIFSSGTLTGENVDGRNGNRRRFDSRRRFDKVHFVP